MIVSELLAEGVFALGKRQDARTDAEFLLCEVLRVNRAELRLLGRDSVAEAARQKYLCLIDKRSRGKPLQHLLGSQPFCGLNLCCDERALIPRPETEELAELAAQMKNELPQGMALDLGTGTGALALYLASRGFEVDATDVSEAAISLANCNAQRLWLSGRVTFYEGSWFAPLPNRRYALIVSNPPYIPSEDIKGLCAEVRDHEPLLALDGGPDGLCAYRDIIACLPDRLLPGGAFLCEVGIGQAGCVADMLKSKGFTVSIKTDAQGIERIIIANWRNSPV